MRLLLELLLAEMHVCVAIKRQFAMQRALDAGNLFRSGSAISIGRSGSRAERKKEWMDRWMYIVQSAVLLVTAESTLVTRCPLDNIGVG